MFIYRVGGTRVTHYTEFLKKKRFCDLDVKRTFYAINSHDVHNAASIHGSTPILVETGYSEQLFPRKSMCIARKIVFDIQLS